MTGRDGFLLIKEIIETVFCKTFLIKDKFQKADFRIFTVFPKTKPEANRFAIQKFFSLFTLFMDILLSDVICIEDNCVSK